VKKLRILLLLVFVLVVMPLVSGWIDCTPSCPTGFTLLGNTSCEGGTCFGTCTASLCNNDWAQISNTNKGWANGGADDDRVRDFTSAYPINSTITSCYRFTFRGAPPVDPLNISMQVNSTPPSDCDSEAIGGFAQGTDGPPGADPWFSGMNNYVGSSPASSIRYLLKTMRAHTEHNSYTSNTNYVENASGGGSIYCTNNAAACIALGGSAICDTDCNDNTIRAYTVQAYVVDNQPLVNQPLQWDANIYTYTGCGGQHVELNRYQKFHLIVNTSSMYTQYNATSCARTNEPPTASNVNVKPVNPTAGHNLLCNYTFSDLEGDFDINSVIYLPAVKF